MKIWRPVDPNNHAFAQANRIGTWAEDGKTRISPLVIEWISGSKIVGDFIWPGINTDIVVRTSIGNLLTDQFGSILLDSIQMVQSAEEPKNRTRARPRVWLPYDGPELSDFQVEKFLDYDVSRSTFETNQEGRIQFTGGEHEETKYDVVTGNFRVKRIPRVLNQGIFIKSSKIQGDCFFKLRNFDPIIYCTDGVKNFIEDKRMTNIDFYEDGEFF